MAKKRKSKPEADAEEATFEQTLEKLEEVVEQLEEGQLGLSESLRRYEEGVAHLKQCYRILEGAERKIELLAGVDAEGRPVSEPFEEDAMTLDEKQASRSRRRTRGERPRGDAAGEDDVDRRGGLF